MFHDPRLHGLLVLGHSPLLGHGELAGLLLLHARLDDAVDVQLVADETSPCVGCSVINLKIEADPIRKIFNKRICDNVE